MNKIAKFEKVSFNQFKKDIETTLEDRGVVSIEDIKVWYDSITLPKRATDDSAGYDFYAPFWFKLSKGETITIPTGIRCKIMSDWMLACFPRSGLGFKYRLQLDNTIGIIDSDYYHSSNEGHILIKITNDSKLNNKELSINEGDRFVQGIFLQYGITTDDGDTDKELRTGGFGSTDKKEV